MYLMICAYFINLCKKRISFMSIGDMKEMKDIFNQKKQLFSEIDICEKLSGYL